MASCMRDHIIRYFPLAEHPPGSDLHGVAQAGGADADALQDQRRDGPGRLGAVKRPPRFPMKIHFVWRFCMGAQGA